MPEADEPEGPVFTTRPDWNRMAQDMLRVSFGTPSRMDASEKTRQQVLDAFGIPPQLRAEWAEADRDSRRHFMPEPQPCRLYPSGTWVHRSPHSCPPYAKG